MSTNYPAALDNAANLPSNRSDATLTPANHASDHNNLADAVIAVQTELGLLPKGSASTVRQRLDEMPLAVVKAGNLADRPTATSALNGVLYCVLDGDGGVWRCNGSTWVLVAPGFNQGVPTGTVLLSMSALAPAGYLRMDGLTEYSRTTYQALWDLLRTDGNGTLQSTAQVQGGGADLNGNGSTTFRTPDARGRGFTNVNQYGSGASAGSANDRESRVTLRGQTTGARLVTLAISEIPAHDHRNAGWAAGKLNAWTDAAGSHSHGGATGTTGSTHSHTTPQFIGTDGVTMAITNSGANTRYKNLGTYSSTNAGGEHTHNIVADGSHSHTTHVEILSNGGGGSHENVGPAMGVHAYIKY